MTRSLTGWRSFLVASLVGMTTAVSGCAPTHPMRAQLAFHLRQTDEAMGSGADEPLYLRYAVVAGGSRWTYEIAMAPGSYAERRTPASGDSRKGAYTFGVDDDRAWLQVADHPTVAVDNGWETEGRTEEAFFGLRFAHPEPDDHTELLSVRRDHWELSFLPHGGRSSDIVVDAATHLPRSLASVDDLDRLTACEDLEWRHTRRGHVGGSGGAGSTPEEGRAVIGSMRCSAIANRLGRIETAYTLEAEESGVPSWARPSSILPTPALEQPSVTRIDEALRIRVPVSSWDPTDSASHPAPRLVLDSGSSATVMTAKTAQALGVIRTGAPGLYVRPPWLKDATYWVGVLDRLRVGTAEIHGATVIVADDESIFGGEPGIIGMDVFRRFIVDVDSPAKVLRIHDPARFRVAAGATDLPIWGTSVGIISVDGAIVGLDEGKIILDTGAPLDVVVTSWEFAALHPRGRGDGMQLGAESADGISPDYKARIQGLWIGPFGFPAMDVYARDRDKYGNINTDGMLALVGMGLMRHFRLAFDVKNAQIHAWPERRRPEKAPSLGGM
jgi:hypothetical protein